jgi:hypothetical protein
MRGFLHITEAVLAIAIVYIVLGQIQISQVSGWTDPDNLPRLQRWAADASTAMCNNEQFRYTAVGGNLPAADFGWMVPEDVDWHVWLYDTAGNILDETGNSSDSATATASCIIAGYLNSTNTSEWTYSPKQVTVAMWNKPVTT